MKSKISIIKAAECVLAYDPDHALQINGVGYNKFDGPIVRDILGYINSNGGNATYKQLMVLYKILKKYKGQLQRFYDIDYDNDVEVPVEATKETIREIDVVEGNFVVVFEYNKEIIKKVKELFSELAKYNIEKKAWIIGINKTTKNSIKELVDTYSFQIDWEEVNKVNIEQPTSHNKVMLTDKLNEIGLFFPYNKEIISAIQTIHYSFRYYSPKDKSWSVKLNKENLDILSKIFKDFNFVYDEKVKAVLNSFYLEVTKKEELANANIEDSKSYEKEFDVEGLKGILRPFQKAGVYYAVKNEKVIIGDEMGLGKTMQAIATVHYKNAFKCLVGCPNSLKYNWMREWEKWTNWKIGIINSENSEEEIVNTIKNNDVIISNYNTIVKYLEAILKFSWKSMIMDESHYLKSKSAQRTQAILKLSKANVELRLLLTGTSVVNRPKELIPQLEILDRLDDFGGFWKFARRYCNAHNNGWGLDLNGASNLPELHVKLRSLCYIRRDKKEVLTDLPDKQRTIVELDIDNDRDYRKAELDLINYLKGITVSLDSLKDYYVSLNKEKKFEDLDSEEIRKLRILYINKRVNSAMNAEHLVRINVLKQLAAKGKIQGIINWIEDFLENEPKLVVFAHHTAIIGQLKEYFKCRVITGEVKVEERQAIVDDFQTNPDSRLIILNLKAGGVGITLTAASNVAIIELPWTPGDLDQAEDRLHRIGQKDAVTAWYLLGRNTIDMDIYDLIAEKRLVTQGVNAGEFVGEDVGILNALVEKLLSKGNNENN